MESATQLPYCYHFGITGTTIRSPKIPVLVDGITIPVIIDTGTEVSMLSDEAMLQLFPEGYWACQDRKVKSLGGSLISVKGPIRLPVEVCTLQLMHVTGVSRSFFHNVTFYAHIEEPIRVRHTWHAQTVTSMFPVTWPRASIDTCVDHT